MKNNCSVKLNNDKRNSQVGATFVEFSLVFAGMVIFAMGLFDLAQIVWLRSAVDLNLHQAVKEIQSNKNLFFDVWNTKSTDPKYQIFRDARADTLGEALENKFADILSSKRVRFQDFTVYDYFDDGTQDSVSSLPVAYLPAGYSAQIEGWETLIHNNFRCSPHKVGQNSLRMITGDGTCSNSNAVDITKASDSLTNLAQTYPIELVAAYEVDTFCFGTVRQIARVSGFATPATQFTIVFPTPTPTCTLPPPPPP